MKECPDCSKKISKKFFGIRSLSKDGLQPACILCMRERRKAAYKNHAESTKKRVNKNWHIRREDPAYANMDNAWRSMGYYSAWGERRYPIRPWARMKDTLPFYQRVQELGPQYCVDHIIPLGGKLVCGLNVPENLQVITHIENRRKGYSYQC